MQKSDAKETSRNMNEMNNKELASLCLIYGAMQKEEEVLAMLDFIQDGGFPVKDIVEIGTGHGGTLWLWRHLPGNSSVISVDLPNGEFGGGLTDDDMQRLKNWSNPGDNIFLAPYDSHLPSTVLEVEDTLRAIGDGQCDILFIDGDHTYEGVKKDFEMYKHLVRAGGLIVLHDIADHSETFPTCTVDKFWKEISGMKMEIIKEPKTWGGIGIIKV